MVQNNTDRKIDSKSKVRLQVQIDQDLKQNVDEVLSDLGMTSTAAITMLFKRIVATDSFPINLQLTEREKASKKLLEATKNIPVRNLNNRKDIEKWLKETSEDDK